MEMHYTAWKGGLDGVGPFLDALMQSFIPMETLVFTFGDIYRAKEGSAGVTNLVSVQKLYKIEIH